MLIYEVVESLILISLLILLIEFKLFSYKSDLDLLEFRYYYSSCMNRVYGDVYLEQVRNIARVFKNNKYGVLELDENC
ncbi:MAG: hypothetical protein QW336_02690, partial [Candidatus Anstonellales archaeon]